MSSALLRRRLLQFMSCCSKTMQGAARNYPVGGSAWNAAVTWRCIEVAWPCGRAIPTSSAEVASNGSKKRSLTMRTSRQSFFPLLAPRVRKVFGRRARTQTWRCFQRVRQVSRDGVGADGQLLNGISPQTNQTGRQTSSHVTVARPFAVGKFHVTVDQFSAFVIDTGYRKGRTVGRSKVEKRGPIALLAKRLSGRRTKSSNLPQLVRRKGLCRLAR
jgi:hypothetical protein